MKQKLILGAVSATAILLISMGSVAAKPATSSQRRAFICNYQAAERSYEGPAMAAYVRRCLRRHHPVSKTPTTSPRKR